MKRQQWTEHTFNLNIHQDWAGNILTRLKDTGIRIKHHCKNLSETQLSYQPDGAWSIKEHIGHLIDLEPLHHKRLIEFISLKGELTGADMSNTKTETADHNSVHLNDLLTYFEKARQEFITEFNELPTECYSHSVLHPRLKVPMKPVDLMFFVAEHDDHHLTTILEIITLLK